MNVKSATRENSSAKIVVQIDSAKFEEGLNKAYLKNRKYITLPGFRKGKAPRKMIEAMYGAEVFYEDAVNEIFPDVYQQAVLDQGWKAVGQPSVSAVDVKDDKSVEMTIETALYPEVTLGQYKGLEIPKEEASVTDEEVESEVDRKANEVARITTVDRPAQDGDTVEIDFEGFVDGVAFEGGKAENYDLKLGSNSFIPGFESQLVGVSAGDEKDINVTFTEDYKKDLAGKPAVFKIKVHEVKQTEIPEKDDEFAKDVSEFDTIADMRADIRAKLLKERQEGIDRAFENAAIEAAAKNMTADIPACMIDEQVEKEMERFDYQLRQQGASLQAYAQMLGGNLDGFKSSIRPSAEQQLRANITLNAIVDEEKIEVSDEELEEEYKKLAETYQMDLEKVKQLIDAEELKGDLAVRKAAKLVSDSAVAVAPKAAEEEKPAKPKRTRKTTKKTEAKAEEKPEEKPEEPAEVKTEE